MSKERTTDSVTAMAERRAKIKEESDRIEQEEAKAAERRQEAQEVQDLKADNAEVKFLEKQSGLVDQDDTREMILDRIRQMREDVPKGPPPPPPISVAMRQQIDAEQEAGRAAVRRAQEEMDRNRGIREEAARDQQQREGTMTPVHHANPGMEQQFPANKATLGKTK